MRTPLERARGWTYRWSYGRQCWELQAREFWLFGLVGDARPPLVLR